MRIQPLDDQTLTLDDDRGMRSVGPAGQHALFRTKSTKLSRSLTSYGWDGGLAVDEARRCAWVSAYGDKAARLDLDSAELVPFDFDLEDVVAIGDGRLLGACAGPGERLCLFTFSDAEPASRKLLQIPDPTPIYVHGLGPYPPRPNGHECFSVRLTRTPAGLAAATALGHLWVQWSDGDVVSWQLPAIFEGSAVAHAFDDGVVVSANPHGNDVSILWFDRRGVWIGEHRDDFKASSPCIPCGDHFYVVTADTLLRFAGRPVTLTGRAVIGARPTDAVVDARGGGRIAIEDVIIEIAPSGETVQRRLLDGSADPVEIDPTGDGPQSRPWRYTLLDDPDLGELWVPDADRTETLVQAVKPLAWPEAQRLIYRETGGTAGYEALEEDSRGAVYGMLRRNYAPRIGRVQTARILARLADPTALDPFLASQLRWSLPSAWSSATPRDASDGWVTRSIPKLCGGMAGELSVTTARVGADVRRWPAWSIEAELEDGTNLAIDMPEFDARWLFDQLDSETHDGGWGEGAQGLVQSTRERVHVQVGRVFGDFVLGVQVEAAGRGTILRTGATWSPIALSDPADVRPLFYAGPAEALFLGRRDGHWEASLTARGLSDARPCTRPPPHRSVAALIEALVEDESLELCGALDDQMLWDLEVRLATAPDDRAAATALEDALLDLDAVDELYADTDELIRQVGPTRAALAKSRGV